VGGYAALAGVSVKLLPTQYGIILPEQVIENIQPHHDWTTRTTLLAIENTVNKGGGAIYTLENMQKLSAICKENKLAFHLDGARIFNACTAASYTPQEVGRLFDSISICFSKGLGTPVGSVLVGNTAFIKKSRRLRKAFGGGMRQVGLLAAACSYALEHHVPLLAHDHARASTLAAALALLPYLDHVLPTHTNIIIFELKKAIIVTDFLTYLSENNLHAVAFGAQKVRFVLHHQIEDTMIEKTIQILNNYTQ
jgi:threonine aldolase